MFIKAAPLFAFIVPTVLGTNILLTNDDGWAVAIIRAQFEALTRAGYDVVLSAPADNKSGTSSNTTVPAPSTAPCEFDTCPTGAPAEGFNATDPRFNYVNEFPADAAKYGIQTLSPKFFGGPPDFVVSGPNVGLNTGPIVNISGTVGAAVEAAREGFPAVAFSADGSSTAQISYTTLASDPILTLLSQRRSIRTLTTKFLAALLSGGVSGAVPKGTILNVNYPGTVHCHTVDFFKFVFTRMNDDPTVKDVTTCGGDHLPSENNAIGSGCYVSVSVANATNKADVGATTQAVVLHRLRSFFSCLP